MRKSAPAPELSSIAALSIFRISIIALSRAWP
jgi:hypothetical protein